MAGHKVNSKSLANLRAPWKPGESGNPLGINRKRPITDRYFERSESPLPEKLRRAINVGCGEEVLGPDATWAQATALRRFMDALTEGGQPSSKEIREAIEGKAPQRFEITSPERKEVTIRVVYAEQWVKK
jgi:hypothetical protein